LVQKFKDEGKEKEIPAAMKQWISQYNFYMAEIKVGISKPLKDTDVKGVKSFEIEGTFSADEMEVDDVAPDTEWKPSGTSLGIDFAIDEIAGILKMIPIPLLQEVLGSIIPKIQFSYKWEGKVAKVMSWGAGNKVRWAFQKVAN
jgi:hypothetical protein